MRTLRTLQYGFFAVLLVVLLAACAAGDSDPSAGLTSAEVEATIASLQKDATAEARSIEDYAEMAATITITAPLVTPTSVPTMAPPPTEAAEAPAAEAPAAEAPAAEAPAAEAPAAEAPAAEAPAAEAPAAEAPAAPAAPVASLPGDPAAGQQIFNKALLGPAAGCKTCHYVDPAKGNFTGPNLSGVATRAGSSVSGQSAQDYLHNSIVDPNAHIVEGFAAGVMPQTFGTTLTEEELNNLVAYLLTLQ